jgi:hypothetical protein
MMRDVFAELVEGINALLGGRTGKLILRSHEVALNRAMDKIAVSQHSLSFANANASMPAHKNDRRQKHHEHA